jgi:hypothetical protein
MDAAPRQATGQAAPSRLRTLLWIALALPAIAQLGLLLWAVINRVGYPFDLEWMEGGLLGHAQRIADRQGIYVEPSIDFIPYLYTPLYPALLALLGGFFGIGYTLGRLISVVAMLATMGFIVAAIVRQRDVNRRAAWFGAAAGVGLFAATYPWVEGWYDLVRADTLFVAMFIGGLLGLHAWALVPGEAGRHRIGAAAAVLALSFFCKQTGVFYVVAGGGALLVLNWRRLPLYIAVSALIGLGMVWLFDRASGGWFWTYVFEVHQAHDWNRDRFVASFGHILGQFPLMTAVIAAGLASVGVTAYVSRQRPPGSSAFLFWAPMFALSCVVGAIGWGTQWAHFNAFIPAMTTGALAAGAAIPAIVGAGSRWQRWPAWWAPALGLVCAAALSAQLLIAWWHPSRFIPSARDREAGDELVKRIREIEGDVFMPYHPWYPVMAGKPLFTHRMGLLDMTYGHKWQVSGLREAFRSHRFAAVILDNRPVGPEFPGLTQSYRMDDFLPPIQAPRVYTGADVMPRALWVPAKPLPLPEGATVLYDFENGRLGGWKTTGSAWGSHPASGPLGNQGPVRRYGGRYYLSSYHGGDQATGTITSPSFVLTGSNLTFRISGGKNEKTLRAELWIDGLVQKVATGNQSEGMEDVMWNIAPYAGRSATIVLVDEDKGPWGHLNVDEIWLRRDVTPAAD